MTARESVAVLVAHPDDETLWAGGTLLTEPTWSPFVWTACRESDVDRSHKFFRVLEYLGAHGKMADLDDGPDQIPLADEAVERALLEAVPTTRFHRILSHSPHGEYTRHRRHEEVARAVLRLFSRGQLAAAELWLFAYEDARGSRVPRAISNADIVRDLPPEIWAQKQGLITNLYGFGPSSWEARATPRMEAFFRVKTRQQASAWLKQERSP